jgi:Ca2+/H+ antiporter
VVIAIIIIIIPFMVYMGILTHRQLRLHLKLAFLAVSQIAYNSFITILIQEDQVTYG